MKKHDRVSREAFGENFNPILRLARTSKISKMSAVELKKFVLKREAIVLYRSFLRSSLAAPMEARGTSKDELSLSLFQRD